MAKSKALKCLVLKKLSIILVIFILSVINIYIKGISNKQTETEQSTTIEQSVIISKQDDISLNDNNRYKHIESNQSHDNLHNINNPNNQGKQSTRKRIRRRLLSVDGSSGKSTSSESSSSSPSSSSSSVSINGNVNSKVNQSETLQAKTSKAKGRKVTDKVKEIDEKSVSDNNNNNSNNNNDNNDSSMKPKNGTQMESGKESGETKSKKRKTSKSGSKKIISEKNGQTVKTKNETEVTTLNPASESPVTVRTHPGPPKTIIPLIQNVKIRECTPPAYKEFPSDIFGHKARKHGAVIIHIAVACYMFYCLAIVCDHYFLTSLEECATRLHLSDDVAGATLMAAGSSAPELFTAILGVFVAKGDVGTGTIVGSAVFNILFVIGLCGVFTKATVLTWWPVARDSSYYSFTVLILILVAYDGEVTTFESSLMLIFYVIYILIMHFNLTIRDLVMGKLREKGYLTDLPENEIDVAKVEQPAPVAYYQSMQTDDWGYSTDHQQQQQQQQQPIDDWGYSSGYQQQQQSSYSNYNGYNQYGQYGDSKLPPSQDPKKTSLYEAAQLVIVRHKRLFPAISRFRAAAHYTIIQNRKNCRKNQKKRQQEFNYKGREGDSFCGMSKVARERITQSPNVEDWSRVPNPVIEGWWPVVKWCTIAPLHATLFYTIPNCKVRTNLFMVTFLMSVFWIAIFSYIMVWMVTLVGFTFGIPDSIMGITFLAAGTSIPDAYASIHVARQGQGDMAVSNSIGSNVFDILVGLALPWFVETAMWQPGTTASINSRGLFYAIILLFLSLMITIYLFHHNRWTLNPKLGYALLTTYAVFLVFCGAMELNLLGYVNPVMCDE